MKRWIAWATGVALLVAPVAGAAPLAETVVDATFASKYMTDGFKIGGDNPVWQLGVGLNAIAGTGASLLAWTSLQQDRLNREYDEVDLIARYGHEFFSGKPLALATRVYFDYWFYPNRTATAGADGAPVEEPMKKGNKMGAGFSLPSLLPIAGSWLVPSYNLHYWTYWRRNQSDRYQGGAHHEFLMEYYHELPKLIPGVVSHYVGLAGSLNYHDGAFGVTPGLSHTTARLSTAVYAMGIWLSASVNQQWSHQPTVDPTDEFWSTISLSKQF